MSAEGLPGFEQEAKSETFFESQFAVKEKLRVAGGIAEVMDIKPDNPKTEVPVFFGPAWGCTLEVYKPALRTLVEQNRRVISLNHPRIGGENLKDISPQEAVEKYPNEELRKALNVIDVLNQKGIEQVDAVTHSESAVNVVIAAMLHPEKFRNIVFFAPAGLIGEDTFTRLLKGFSGQSKRAESLKATGHLPEIPLTETEKNVASVAMKEGLKYFAKNPIRAIKEARDISKSQIHDIIRYLHKEKGIGIIEMSGVDDPVFPMERMQKMVKAGMIDGFLSLRGGHGEIGNHPELYMTAAEQMLTAVEEKKR